MLGYHFPQTDWLDFISQHSLRSPLHKRSKKEIQLALALRVQTQTRESKLTCVFCTRKLTKCDFCTSQIESRNWREEWYIHRENITSWQITFGSNQYLISPNYWDQKILVIRFDKSTIFNTWTCLIHFCNLTLKRVFVLKQLLSNRGSLLAYSVNESFSSECGEWA